jgi:hypothetical protein
MPSARLHAFALLAIALAACGGGTPEAAPVTASPTPGTSLTTNGTVTTSPPAVDAEAASVLDDALTRRLLRWVALRPKDGASARMSFKVKPAEDGDELEGHPTFDLCGRRFNSEKDRVARYRVDALTEDGGATGGGDEVVAYDSEASAIVALDELRSVVRRCTLDTDLRDGLYGGGLQYRDVEQRKLDLPAEDNVYVLLTVQRAGLDHLSRVQLIVQRHGAVLDVLVSRSPRKFTREQVANHAVLARKIGARLVDPAGVD